MGQFSVCPHHQKMTSEFFLRGKNLRAGCCELQSECLSRQDTADLMAGNKSPTSWSWGNCCRYGNAQSQIMILLCCALFFGSLIPSKSVVAIIAPMQFFAGSAADCIQRFILFVDGCTRLPTFIRHRAMQYQGLSMGEMKSSQSSMKPKATSRNPALRSPKRAGVGQVVNGSIRSHPPLPIMATAITRIANFLM
jgi:hypothetical protein